MKYICPYPAECSFIICLFNRSILGGKEYNKHVLEMEMYYCWILMSCWSLEGPTGIARQVRDGPVMVGPLSVLLTVVSNVEHDKKKRVGSSYTYVFN